MFKSVHGEPKIPDVVMYWLKNRISQGYEIYNEETWGVFQLIAAYFADMPKIMALSFPFSSWKLRCLTYYCLHLVQQLMETFLIPCKRNLVKSAFVNATPMHSKVFLFAQGGIHRPLWVPQQPLAYPGGGCPSAEWLWVPLWLPEPFLSAGHGADHDPLSLSATSASALGTKSISGTRGLPLLLHRSIWMAVLWTTGDLVLEWTNPDPLRHPGELLLKIGVSKSWFSFDAVLVQAIVRDSCIEWTYWGISFLFPFSPQSRGCCPCFSSLSRASCLPWFLWSVFAQQVSHFPCTSAFSVQGVWIAFSPLRVSTKALLSSRSLGLVADCSGLLSLQSPDQTKDPAS